MEKKCDEINCDDDNEDSERDRDVERDKDMDKDKKMVSDKDRDDERNEARDRGCLRVRTGTGMKIRTCTRKGKRTDQYQEQTQ